MHTKYFTERFFLIATLAASIGFYFNLILQRPQKNYHRRASSYSKGCSFAVSKSTMVLSHLLHASNVGTVDASTEESVTTVSSPKASMTPISLNQDEASNTACTRRASSITVEDIELPGHRVVDGIDLKRNGHGLRSLTYFGIGIRIYVASMYSARPILSADQAMGETSTTDAPDNGPIQLDFTFLRYVRQSQVVSAWKQQLDHSVTHKDYEGYEADRERFIELASGGPIQKQGTQSVLVVGDETRIIDQGRLTGVIHGRNFQLSFLSMWFGSMAVAEDLKANLLRGDEHLREELEQEVEEELRQQTLVKA